MSSNNPFKISLELDSHVDTADLGAGALIIQSYNQPMEVVGYDPQQGSQTFKTVSGVLAFDHPKDQRWEKLKLAPSSILKLDQFSLTKAPLT
jgi:hypothetical protein